MPDTTQPIFTDLFERTLDAGQRVVLPKDWRDQGITELFMISDSTGSFIKVFPRAEYDKAVAKIVNDTTLNEKVRGQHLEEIGSECKRVKLDNANRLVLPDQLCADIGVSSDKPSLVLKGAVNTFNIWNPAKLANHAAARKALAAAGTPAMSAKEFLGV